MLDISLLVESIAILAIVLVVPGPMAFLIVKTSAQYGRASAFFLACGNAVSVIIWNCIVIFGLSFLVENNAIRMALDIFSGIFFLFIGVMSYLARNKAVQQENVSNSLKIKSFSVGFVMNILNPMVGIFYIALLTKIMSKYAENFGLVVFHSVAFVSVEILWFGVILVLLSGLINGFLVKYNKPISIIFSAFISVVGARMLFVAIKEILL